MSYHRNERRKPRMKIGKIHLRYLKRALVFAIDSEEDYLESLKLKYPYGKYIWFANTSVTKKRTQVNIQRFYELYNIVDRFECGYKYP